MKVYAKGNKLKYQTKDTSGHVYHQIKTKADAYLNDPKMKRMGQIALWIKFISLCAIIGISYNFLIHATTFNALLISYLIFGFVFLLLGINFGHDAAHHCVSGNRIVDSILFQLIFGLQGLSSYIWQIRHNFSHHIFPNVYENDTDLEISDLILLSPHQKKLAVHKYQHIYAIFLYMLFSLSWIFVVDFKMLTRKKHANINIGKVPVFELVKLVIIKAAYICIFLVLPAHYSSLSYWAVIGAYLIMNIVVSVFLAFTFFISHHVNETEYLDAIDHEKTVPDSWIRRQIVSTVDFNTHSAVANYLFGGFNLHVAHHLFPGLSHIYYPRLTRMIKETLEENNLNWYQSYSFFDGVVSHLSLLKKNGRMHA